MGASATTAPNRDDEHTLRLSDLSAKIDSDDVSPLQYRDYSQEYLTPKTYAATRHPGCYRPATNTHVHREVTVQFPYLER
jgi:hypothetical protein